MTTTIHITAQTLAGLEANTQPGYTLDKRYTKRLPDGTYDVVLDDDVMARLNQMRFQGESDNDLVARVLATYRGRN